MELTEKKTIIEEEIARRERDDFILSIRESNTPDLKAQLSQIEQEITGVTKVI